MKKLTLIAAVVALAGMASAQLVTNGDFEDPGGADWGIAVSGDMVASFPASGGNGGGYAQLDMGAAGWGGVLINDNDTPASLASLGLTDGVEYTFTIDLIDLADNGAVGGMKIESWSGAGLGSNSGDITFAATTSWDTYTFDYTIDAGATGVKFVPLLVVQPNGSSYGYDNVGVVPEPATIGLLGIGAAAMLVIRRRRV